MFNTTQGKLTEGIIMGLFNRKERLSESQLSEVLVSTIFNDINAGYPEIVKTLKELPFAGKLVHSLHRNSKQFWITALFSMELLSIPKMFDEDQANRIMKFCIDELSKKLGVDQSDICSSIDEYTAAFRKGVEFVTENPSISLNPLEFVSEILYDRMQIEKIEVANRIVPSSVLLSAISAIITRLGGYMKDIKARCKIVKD